VTDKFEFIDAEYAAYRESGHKYVPSIVKMCIWMEVSRSGFYEWRDKPESATAKRRGILALYVRKSFGDSDDTYGYRRVHADLVAWGVPAGPEQQGQGICAICAGFEYDVVYVVRNPVMNCVKFGITNSEGKSRLRVHRGNGFTEVIRLETGLPDGLAEIIEKKIRVALDMAGAKPLRGREYFSDEHIALIENEIENWVPLPGQLTAVMLPGSPIVAVLPPPVTVADDLPQVTVDPFGRVV